MTTETEKRLAPLQQLSFSAQAWEFLAGLAADYWKDGHGEEAPKPRPRVLRHVEAPPAVKTEFWQQDRAHILETIWGHGHVLPGGNEMIDILSLPLGTNKEISALDLSAGLGAVGRRLGSTLQTYVTGLEPDPTLVAYGTHLLAEQNLSHYATLEVYNPETYAVDKHYDCLFARELFYRVKDKPKFFQAVRDSLKENPKPYAQMVFTDYLLDPAHKAEPAIVSWLQHEPEALPVGLAEMAKLWKKHYFDIRVKEDLTEMYVHDIKTSLANFVLFLKDHKLTPEAKIIIAKEIERWAYREAAFEHGLKFYRFYAIR